MTSRQSEAVLEEKLISQLAGQGYERIIIKDEYDLSQNFRKQLGKHNNIEFSDEEFKQVIQYLDKPVTIYEKSKNLREKAKIILDDGEQRHIEFFNQEKWCQNIFQVSNQITMVNPKNKIENRYDVTILINGLPMVQIELKRRGIEIKEAYNQTIRYNHQTMHNLFGYIQVYVISNGVNTKYYANNRDLRNLWKQTFDWTDEKNKSITNLDEFAEVFLEKCHLAKMIIKYIVLNNGHKCLMILRPYQYYAVERIMEQVENGNKNGYVWHTTGSGKTLTSFKASQLLTKTEGIFKVLFVVDRNDLDYQTQKEFNSFEKGSVDGTDNTSQLVKHLTDPNKPLLITTIQKLNNAISKLRHSKKMEEIKDEKFIFIFDECHRSQFGETNKKIKEYFSNHQMFGFTGTPILEKNAIKNQTTKSLFGDRLHEYTIKDAIKDDNVLGFSVEYIGKYVKKEDGRSEYEIMVEDIDTGELYEDPKRLERIVEYIRSNHTRKTFTKKYQSIFAISNIKTLRKYYDIFKEKAPELKIATIFSFAANENLIAEKLENEEKGNIECNIGMDDLKASEVDHDSRDALERFMKDYNKTYGGNYSLNVKDGYNAYFKNIAKNVKEQKIDVLLVVNMFLTGFDSKTLNTLYVDKNLKYHGLIQAFSRTNRILNEEKSHGNIVCFRNLKEQVDEAITLYSDGKASEEVLMKPYEFYLDKFNEKIKELKEFVPTVNSVDALEDEGDKATFIEIFRDLI
ncbi:MAG: type I restriction endonuclease subunit R, partial [Psychrilyobacter sp.]|uniref:type I restriction endonuclease subunit R n=1 Tax=Psychrilyobacter sp. TaxID=2586924 RepID=UPI003C747817